jgi:hypothetical protein
MLGGWTQSRDLQALPPQTFREWWEQRNSTPRQKASVSKGGPNAG